MTARTAFIVMVFLGSFWSVYGLFDVTGWSNFVIGVIVTCVGVMGQAFLEFDQ